MVEPTCHPQENVFFILVIFNFLLVCVLASERNEMVGNWLMTFFSLTCPGITWFHKFSLKKRSHRPLRCINLIYIEDADFVMMTRQLGNKTVK